MSYYTIEGNTHDVFQEWTDAEVAVVEHAKRYVMDRAPEPKKRIPVPLKEEDGKTEDAEDREDRYCVNCGAYLPRGKKRCLACGIICEQERRPRKVPDRLYETEEIHADVLDLDSLYAGGIRRVKIGGRIMIAEAKVDSEQYHLVDYKGEHRRIYNIKLMLEEM